MLTFLMLPIAMLSLTLTVYAEATPVLFADKFEEQLADGWTWLREDSDDWRIADGALDIRARPGDAQTARNALLRPLPEMDGGGFAVEVTITFTAPLTQHFEQAGITWYADGAPVFKLVHELIDNEYFIIPGRVPTEKKTVRLRLEVRGTAYTAKFREEGEEVYRVAEEGELLVGDENKISLQTYHGPANADHWMRFTDFKILALPDAS